MKTTILSIIGLIISLPVFSQTDPSNTAGYDQQKLALIVPASLTGLTLTTDSSDYHPGSTVLISGSGFQPWEIVTMQVVHTSGMYFNDTSVQYQPWNVTADANGEIQASWLVGMNELGANLKVTADGHAYGFHTEALFTDDLPPNTSFIIPDGTYTTFPGNDDGSTASIPIPFTFNLYGTNFTHVYVNNNGNITFAAPSGVFSSTGFPSSVPMVAPFWSDVDTRVGNIVKYKVNPTNMIVTWQGVGYFNRHVDKLNTFQVIITNGNDTSIGIGNNVCFRYQDMNWTTGDASGGSGGFGGTPATVGVNNGNGINYVQMGRFSVNSSVYDGGGGANDGINYLDNRNYLLNVSNAINQPPSVSGVPSNNKIEMVCGTTQTMSLSFLPPEVGQSVTASVNTGGLCNTSVSTTSGSVSNANVTITAAACNLGSHIITFTATDNYITPASTTVSVTVNVVAPTATASNNGPVCSGSDVHLFASGGTSYSWTGPAGYTSTAQNPIITGVTSANAGTYTVTVSSGGCTSSATTTAIINPVPNFAILSTGTISDCAGGTVTLEVPNNDNNFATYLWSTGNQQTSSISVSSPEIYSVRVTNNNGCSSTESITVVSATCIHPLVPSPENGKVDSVNLIGAELTSLYLNFDSDFVATTDTSNAIFIIKGDSVMIEIISLKGKTDSLFILLQTSDYGMSDFVSNGDSSLIITGKFLISNLGKLNLLPNLIDYCRPVYPANLNSGIAYDKGDSAMYTELVRGGFNVSGQGVKVGVMSDSYNRKFGNPAATDVLNGDLPDSVQVLREYPGIAGDEGRAMMQIVHDIAPNAQLAFRTGFISAGDMAEGIKQLQDEGCNVIVDDITFITEPFFQDGEIAKAVDAATSAGVSYFTSAGNFGSKSYENEFAPAPPPSGMRGNAHDFGGGDIRQSITLAPGVYTIVLQWDDKFYSMKQLPGAENDLDIYLTDNLGNRLFGFNRNNIGADPLEILPFTVSGTSTTNIMIVKASGTGNVRFKYVVFQGNLKMNEYAHTGASTIVGQANSAGAMTIGAVLYKNTPAFGVNPPTVASFSSRGGTLVNNIVRNKPDFCAPNGVNTTVDFGGGLLSNIDANEGDPFPNFFGTSCAAPHAAAVAALLIEAKNKFDNVVIAPSEVRTLLHNTSTDMEVAGDDTASGSGLINAEAAMETFASPTPYISELIVPSGFTAGLDTFTVVVTGAYFVNTTQILFRGVSIQTHYISSTQLSATINPFEGNPPINAYTPPISSLLNDGGNSDTLYFFSPIKKSVVVNIDDKTKKYGEKNPAFTASVLVDNVPLELTSYTKANLGLDNLEFLCTATSSSYTGIYLIDSLNVNLAVKFTELFNYSFNFGLLVIEKMPLVISPRDTTIFYGDNLVESIHYNYDYDHSKIDSVNEAQFAFAIQNDHHAGLIDGVALFNGGHGIVSGGHGIVSGGHGIVSAELEGLSILLSRNSLFNGGIGVVNGGHGIVSGGHGIVSSLPDTTLIIDIPSEIMYQYLNRDDSVDLVGGLGAFSGYQLANGGIGVVNGGFGVVNGGIGVVNGGIGVVNGGIGVVNGGIGIVNGGIGIVNGGFGVVNGGHGIVSSSTITDSSNRKVVMIFDSLDIFGDTVSGLVSVNLITGFTVGDQTVVPGAFVSDLFDVTYHYGLVHIQPAPLIVEADNKQTACGVQPSFTSQVFGYQYNDNAASVIAVPASYHVLNGMTDMGTGNVYGGPFSIVPSGIQQIDSNYVITYLSGTLTSDPQLTATKVVGVIPCNGGTTTVTISANGGVPPYSGEGVKTVSAGPYSFTVSDSKGCSVIVSGTITQPNILTAAAFGNIACYNGLADVTVTASGGTLSYTGTGLKPGQGPGMHSYLVTDAHGCTATANITLVNPSPIIVTAVADPIACFGDNTCVTVSATGGSGIYTSGTGTTCFQDAGNYIYTVTDIKSCTGSLNFTIIQPDKLQGTVAVVNATCGLNNGSATVTPIGGSGTKTYSWNTVPVRTTQTASGLSAGTYTVTITDANSCIGMATAVVQTIAGGLPAAPGAVSGPAGACKNQTGVQYCVTAVTGVTYYLWTIPPFATITSGQGTPCITVSFGGTYAGGFICVTDSNACGRNLSGSCKNVPVLIAIPANPVLSGPSYVCPNTSAVYTTTASNAINFVWTVTGGLIISSGQGTSSVVITAPPGFSYGSVGIQTSNCMGASNKTATNIITGVPSQPQWTSTSSASHSICGGTTYCGWEIDKNDTVRATSYLISGPAGSTLSSHGITGNPITTTYRDFCVTVPAGFISGNITIIGIGFCGSSSAFVWPIYSTPPTPGTITGPVSLLCGTTGKVYSIAAVPVATSYSWTVPAGATITSNSGTSITVSFSSSASSGNICVKANNSACGTSSAYSCLAVSTAPAQPGVISGALNVCKSQNNVMYTIAAVTGATTYTWSISGGAAIQTGQGTTSIKVKYASATSTLNTISVVAKNNCGTSIARTLNVSVNLSCRTSGTAETAEAAELNAYPNPTSGKLNVVFNATEKEKYVLILTDLIGSVLIHEVNTASEGNNLKELDLGGISSGMYLLSIEREGIETKTMRIVVQ